MYVKFKRPPEVGTATARGDIVRIREYIYELVCRAEDAVSENGREITENARVLSELCEAIERLDERITALENAAG